MDRPFSALHRFWPLFCARLGVQHAQHGSAVTMQQQQGAAAGGGGPAAFGGNPPTSDDLQPITLDRGELRDLLCLERAARWAKGQGGTQHEGLAQISYVLRPVCGSFSQQTPPHRLLCRQHGARGRWAVPGARRVCALQLEGQQGV